MKIIRFYKSFFPNFFISKTRVEIKEIIRWNRKSINYLDLMFDIDIWASDLFIIIFKCN